MHQESLRADELNKELFEKYSTMVYRLAYSLVKNRYDADDIHQEVFVRYICTRPEFENEQHERAWFLRVTVNLCKNLWKSSWKQRMLSIHEFDFEEIDEDRRKDGLADDSLSPQEDSPVIAAVKSLPNKYKAVIHLFYFEELSVEEIAGILKEKPATVRTQLTRARRKLGKILKEEI